MTFENHSGEKQNNKQNINKTQNPWNIFNIFYKNYIQSQKNKNKKGCK